MSETSPTVVCAEGESLQVSWVWAGRAHRPSRRGPADRVLISLLALTMAYFGIAATDGLLQVALLLSAAFASLIGFKNGYTVAAVANQRSNRRRDVAVGAIFILLAALIGTSNMDGTIPTVVYYGIGLLSPAWFYFA